VALFAYEGAGRAVIARLKFANHRDALAPMATMLAAAIDAPVDLVTWVPTSAGRRRERGFDQAELIARAVARSLGVPARATVRRTGRSPQTGQGRSQRLTTRFVPRRPVPGSVVAVVDDVRTTGASLVGVARAVRDAGAVGVVGATFAATPRSLSLPRVDPLQSS
jgi:predicted amidophosphoribosyltransferase